VQTLSAVRAGQMLRIDEPVGGDATTGTVEVKRRACGRATLVLLAIVPQSMLVKTISRKATVTFSVVPRGIETYFLEIDSQKSDSPFFAGGSTS
jgi:hypothetical protein